MQNIVISLGGSLISPKDGVNIPFLREFNQFIRNQIKDFDRRFFIVCGGGNLAREYQNAAKAVIGEINSEDVDWMGIHSTRLNAHLLRTIFRDLAYSHVKKDYAVSENVTESVLIASGWKPGWSTDYDAVMLAEEYQAKVVVNLSNIEMLYDKDPKTFPEAKAIPQISWMEYRKMVGDKWDPGMNTPFDPVAAKKAEELKLEVVILKGDNLANVKKYLDKEEFVGTVIK